MTKGRRKSVSKSRKQSSACNDLSMLNPISVSSDDGFRSCHEDEDMVRQAQTEKHAITVLKKKYESDEEEKAPEVSTSVPESIALSADDALMPPGYIDAYNKVFAQITDEEEKSKSEGP